MNKRFAIFVLAFAATVSWAQEKPVPGQRQAGVTPPDSIARPAAQEPSSRTTQGLPKFEIPEYVITGVVTLDLPDASKQEASESVHLLELADPATFPRDRSSHDFLADDKTAFVPASPRIRTGRLAASSGKYLTSHVGIRHASYDASYSFGFEGDYRSAKAFVPFSHRSSGELRVRGGVLLNSPMDWYDRGILGSEMRYGSETYRFYGAPDPSLTRTITRFDLAARYNSPREFLHTYDANLGLSLNSVKDTTTSLTETLFEVGAGVNLMLGTFPLDSRIDFTLASLTGTTTQSFPFVDARISTEKLWYGGFFIQASLHGYLAQGMMSQKFARAYPHITLGYRVLRGTTLSLSYAGRVQQNTLSRLLSLQPYLSAGATLRQSDIPIDGAVALETDWSPVWRTRFSARFQSVRDFPLFTNGSSRGIWTTDYRGTTKVSTFQADLFAKFDANGYFTMSLEINDSKNTVTEWKVPYLPELRASVGAWFELAPGLGILPTVSYVGKRVPDLFVASKLKEYVCADLHAEYALLHALGVTLDLRNLTNSKFEEWSGYQAVPLTITAGVNIRW
jgi:hypothetical protein